MGWVSGGREERSRVRDLGEEDPEDRRDSREGEEEAVGSMVLNWMWMGSVPLISFRCR